MYHSSSVQLLRMWTVEIRHAIKPLRHHQRRSHRLSLKRSHFSTMKTKKTTKIPWIPWIQLCPIPIIVQMWNWAIWWKKNQNQSRIYLVEKEAHLGDFYCFDISSRWFYQQPFLHKKYILNCFFVCICVLRC